jgi:hypothetical protein
MEYNSGFVNKKEVERIAGKASELQGAGSGSGEKILSGPPSKGGPAKNLYTRFVLMCKKRGKK